MHERVFGPVRGRYIASYAARVGGSAHRFTGHWKICDDRPSGFFGADAVCSGSCRDAVSTLERALLDAEDLALSHLQEMPEGTCRALRDEPLAAIMYVSNAHRPQELDTKRLERLLESARQRNASFRITGVLLAFKGRFMQYIEGPAAQLEWVYRVIQVDLLHHSLVELLREPIAAREFSDWTMAFGSPEIHGQEPAAVLPALFTSDTLPRKLLRGFLERGA